MKTLQSKSVYRLFLMTLFMVVTVWSCQNEDDHLAPRETTTQLAEESAIASTQIVSASHDILDLTAGALASQGVASGRYTPYGKMRTPDITCSSTISGTFNVDKSHPDSVIYSGSLTIDFGDGSSCKDSTEVLKGKITDTFTLIVGNKLSAGFNLTESIAFEGFQKDSIGIDGTFISKTVSPSLSMLTIQNAKITFEDGTSSTWNGSLTNTYDRGDNEWAKDDDSKEVTGSLSGTTRSGVSFSATITKAILFQYSCSKKYPVSGTIELTLDGTNSTIDYGAGTCDKTYTISTNGQLTEVKFPGKGSDHGDKSDD